MAGRATWVHMLCGAETQFPDDVDPNKINAPCMNCGVALGGWAPA